MKLWILLGALNGFMAVGFGAFAAHGLKARATPTDLAAFNTGADYLYHLGLTGSRSLVLVTPMGGTAFLIGWLCLAIAAYRLA